MLRAASLCLLGAAAVRAQSGYSVSEYYCDDEAATNYKASPGGTSVGGPWMCKYTTYGCPDKTADNYASYVSGEYALSYMCQFGGCNDTDASNFDSKATYNDGTCVYALMGCTVRFYALRVGAPQLV